MRNHPSPLSPRPPLLSVICYLLSVICYPLSVICYLLSTICYLLSSPLLLAASPSSVSLRVSAERQRIYLGESVVIQVAASGTRDGSNIPAFANPDGIEYVTSRDETRRSTIIINGKMTVDSYEGRTFVFRATPSEAGVFDTGEVTMTTPGGIVRAPGIRVSVSGVEARDDISVRIECAKESVLVDEPFKIRMVVSIKEPRQGVEPLFPGRPPHIDAAYLSEDETKGLSRPDSNTVLGRFAPRDTFFSGRSPSFTINSFADVFGRAIDFRLPPTRVKSGDAFVYEYSVEIPYTPKAEGTYTFGPATLKGQIIVAVNDRMEATLDEVFVIGPAATVRVEPPPEEGRPDWFVGPVGKSMRARASFDTARCKVGDPLTLSIDVDGEFSLSNLRPPVLALQAEAAEAFRLYDENVETEPIENGRRFKYRVRPIVSGTLEFPAVRLAYYDTERREYVTVATDPMPLQVEETTRIAASSSMGEEGDAQSSALLLLPDGIILSPADTRPHFIADRRMRPLLIVAPLLWLLCALVRPFRRLAVRAASALRERSSRSTGDMSRALALAESDPALAASKAIGAARKALSARLRMRTASPSADDIASALAKHSVADGEIRDLVDSFSDLERLSYASGAADKSSVVDAVMRLRKAIDAATRRLGALAVVLSVTLLGAGRTEASSQPPPTFEWERATQAMSTAATEEEFLDAARIYFAMRENGYGSGALDYNLGVALLLAGRKGAAMEAFVAAGRRLGTPMSVANSMKASLSEEGAPGTLPASRTLLAWHYGPSLATRIDIAAIGWIAFWFAAAVLAVVGRRPSVFRGAIRAIAVCALALLAIYGASVAATLAQTRSDDLPRVRQALAADAL